MASNVAQKRLFHEYKNLSTNPPDGITAGPISEDDMFYWEALIEGPGDTPFEGGVFAAELKFPKDYPLSPPTMKFIGGGVWHPNGTYPMSFPPIAHPILCLRLTTAQCKPCSDTS
jgi:ubiquitin-conjugating enzyme E2 G2